MKEFKPQFTPPLPEKEEFTQGPDIEKNLEELRIIKKQYPYIFKEHSFLLFSLKKLLDRNPETFKHTERVTKYAEAIGNECLDEKEKFYLLGASLAHDTGKTDKDILSLIGKERKLSDEEFNTLKKHSKIAHNLCKENDAPMMGEIVIRSHEHQGGRSYPRIKEDRRRDYRDGEIERREENPIAEKLSRILAISDVFNALISKRPYKPARELNEVILMLEKQFSQKKTSR